jgi:tripartite-type tricarboxylate transporter receptor subunit TctC
MKRLAPPRRVAALAVAGQLLAAAAGGTAAQEWPARQVRIVVPSPPAGGTDLVARIVATGLGEAWARPLLVDNRPGANGSIGTELVAKSPPDGYTLVMGHTGTHAIAASLQKNLRYDPARDFVPVVLVAKSANVLVANPSVPARSVKDLVVLARRNPGKVAYASGGVGFSQHLAGVLFGLMTGTQLLHVPYKGGTPALSDVIAGHVELMFPNVLAALPHIRSGRLRALGVTSASRTAVLPDVSSIAESGLPGYEAVVWFGLFAPRGTPAQVVERVNADVIRLLRQPAVVAQVTAMGGDPGMLDTAGFAAFVATEVKKWAEVVKVSGATAE